MRIKGMDLISARLLLCPLQYAAESPANPK
jgi:hypothetical protein